jgi:hypothetical protein
MMGQAGNDVTYFLEENVLLGDSYSQMSELEITLLFPCQDVSVADPRK